MGAVPLTHVSFIKRGTSGVVPVVFLVSMVTHHLHHRATVKPFGSHRRYLPVTHGQFQKKSFIGVWQLCLYVCVFVCSVFVYSCVCTLIMENREQANNLLNSVLMSNKSTSLRVTITLIRVLSSVPAPCNKHMHIIC